jgi:Uma2 family endonuclease
MFDTVRVSSGVMAELHVTRARPETQPEAPPPEFPGCRPVRISRAEIAACERRIEYWEAATETAMVCDPVSTYHELPGQRLRELATRIAMVRGSPIETFGAADLLLRDADGAWLRILEADQTLYLHPRTTRPHGARIEVGSGTLPDVVLEVDNTTDVRRGKLALYESWGFPEVWVEVPDRYSPSRPAGLRPGLTIHLWEDGGFRPAASSRAFPGWTAPEIHRALNEREVSAVTMAALRRVGQLLGAALGTGPDDDPLLRAERNKSRTEGRTEGRAEGRVEMRWEAVLHVLNARGVPLSAELSEPPKELRAVPTDTLVRAALHCRDETDFLRLARRG